MDSSTTVPSVSVGRVCALALTAATLVIAVAGFASAAFAAPPIECSFQDMPVIVTPA